MAMHQQQSIVQSAHVLTLTLIRPFINKHTDSTQYYLLVIVISFFLAFLRPKRSPHHAPHPRHPSRSLHIDHDYCKYLPSVPSLFPSSLPARTSPLLP